MVIGNRLQSASVAGRIAACGVQPAGNARHAAAYVIGVLDARRASADDLAVSLLEFLEPVEHAERDDPSHDCGGGASCFNPTAPKGRNEERAIRPAGARYRAVSIQRPPKGRNDARSRHPNWKSGCGLGPRCPPSGEPRSAAASETAVPFSGRSASGVPPGRAARRTVRSPAKTATRVHWNTAVLSLVHAALHSAVLTKKQLARLRAASAPQGSNRVGLAISLAGVSQGTVARAVGMPQPYVSDVVRGRYRTITVANARKFARYFGCLMEDLFPADAG